MLTMHYKKYLLVVLALLSLTDAVKVNVQGSLSFGAEVLDTITHYVQRNFVNPSMRRSMPFSRKHDVIHLTIKSAYLCSGLHFCDAELEKFLNEYILVQTKSIEAIFMEIVNHKEMLDEESELRLIFEEELKKCLGEIRKLLKINNVRAKEKNYTNLWIEIIKKISVMFQTSAILLANEQLEGSLTDMSEVMKKLTQKFVIAAVIVEGKYESKLCIEHKICSKAIEVTKALNSLLEAIMDLDEDKVKIFIRYVSEALQDTQFYSHLSEVTANELQIILNDMAYSDNVPSKEVLRSVHKTVEDRLSSLTSQSHVINGKDVELVHAILSDMDHVYAKQGVDPFHGFMSNFFLWVRTGSRLGGHVRSLLQDISAQLHEVSDDCRFKIVNEVRVFLEITVDPEKQ